MGNSNILESGRYLGNACATKNTELPYPIQKEVIVTNTKFLRMSFSVLVIGLILLLAGPDVSVAEPVADAPPIRTAYVFAFDEDTGRDYRDLLVRDGYDLVAVMLPMAYGQSIYLPMQVGAGTARIQTFSRPLSVGAAGLEGYDLYIIADDTEGLWESHAVNDADDPGKR